MSSKKKASFDRAKLLLRPFSGAPPVAPLLPTAEKAETTATQQTAADRANCTRRNTKSHHFLQEEKDSLLHSMVTMVCRYYYLVYTR